MQENFDTLTELQAFVNFTDDDVENLKELAPLFAEHGEEITLRFYDKLQKNPETAALVEGRVDTLRKTHGVWMSELFSGDYGEAYLERRWNIGLTHVRVNVPPHYVEAVFSFLRAESERLIFREIEEPARAAELHTSLLKILDLDLMVINLAYAEERVDRLCKFTGMSKKLIARCIAKG